MDFSFSTSLFYSRSNSAMSSLTASANRLYEELSTNKRILSPSDDSAAWAKLQGLAQAKANAGVDSANVKLAQGILGQADSTLSSIRDQLQSASDLAVQAGNGTLSADAKKAIAEQLRGILDSVVSLANTKDGRGQPIFGGTNDGAGVSIVDGALTFPFGDPGGIPIGDGQTVSPSVNAKSFLKSGDDDIATVLTGMIAALNNGDALPEGSADALKSIADQTTSAQASLGARAARVDLVAAQQTNAAVDREAARSSLEDVDVSQAITDLQKTMTVLSATQASFSKLSGLSLFDYLR
jgi:flagellar hook-associated protein 3 FlgL